eukprot:Skav233441  [mRNA]  locus=scaffold1486:326292:329895:- [translate_table: standard]
MRQEDNSDVVISLPATGLIEHGKVSPKSRILIHNLVNSVQEQQGAYLFRLQMAGCRAPWVQRIPLRVIIAKDLLGARPPKLPLKPDRGGSTGALSAEAPLTWAWLIPSMIDLVGARVGMTSSALTSGTFEGFIRGADKALVDFYDRTQLGSAGLSRVHCLALQLVRDYGSKVAFATVDAVAEKDLAKRYVPNGNYPQLMWFTHGEPTQYHRSLRTAKAMTDFVLALDRDPMLEACSIEDLQ